MSRYTYAGPYRNPTESWTIKSGAELIECAEDEARAERSPDKDLHGLSEGIVLDHELLYVAVEEKVHCDCHCPDCRAVLRTRYRLHTSHATGKWEGCVDYEDADELIEAVRERFDDDYEDYLDENRHSIAQMERYEAFMNEY